MRRREKTRQANKFMFAFQHGEVRHGHQHHLHTRLEQERRQAKEGNDACHDDKHHDEEVDKNPQVTRKNVGARTCTLRE
jgi:hypothetical protein